MMGRGSRRWAGFARLDIPGTPAPVSVLAMLSLFCGCWWSIPCSCACVGTRPGIKFGAFPRAFTAPARSTGCISGFTPSTKAWVASSEGYIPESERLASCRSRLDRSPEIGQQSPPVQKRSNTSQSSCDRKYARSTDFAYQRILRAGGRCSEAETPDCQDLGHRGLPHLQPLPSMFLRKHRSPLPRYQLHHHPRGYYPRHVCTALAAAV